MLFPVLHVQVVAFIDLVSICCRSLSRYDFKILTSVHSQQRGALKRRAAVSADANLSKMCVMMPARLQHIWLFL